MRRHWRRLFVQFAILALMVVVYSVSDQLFSAIVSLSLVIIPTATWTVFGVLLWLSGRAPEIETLRERTDDALSAAMGSTAAAVVGATVLLRLAGVITVSVAPVLSIGLAFVVVTVSIPSLLFVRTAVRVWLPMVRAQQIRITTNEVEHRHEARMDAMEGRLNEKIDIVGADAKAAYHEANNMNLRSLAQDTQIAEQGKLIAEQGERAAATVETIETTAAEVHDLHQGIAPETKPTNGS